jgi:DNA processing protein
MTREELWIWYATLLDEPNGITYKTFESTQEIKEVYEAGIDQLVEQYKFSKKEAEQIEKSKESGKLEICMKRMREGEIHFVTVEDKLYPERLKQFEDKPKFLFYKGNLPKEYLPTVGMVGARACTNYGRNMAKMLGEELSSNHIQIISGLARGIDTYSMIGAISGKTPTFAVLGSGVDVCYPIENIELYEEILNNGGGIISEFIPGSSPLQWHFPVRNRIISGLSDKVAVIEAREKSGSLITVEYALEQGKDVWAVPGRVGDSLSSGCNRLLKCGAGVLTSGYDIIEDMSSVVKDIKQLGAAKEEQMDMMEETNLKVYRAIESYPQSITEIMKKTQLGYEKIIEILLCLQMSGVVEEISKNYFVRCIK